MCSGRTCADGAPHQKKREMMPADRGTKGRDARVTVESGELPRPELTLLFVKNDSSLTGLGFIWDHINRVSDVSRKFPHSFRDVLEVWSRFAGGLLGWPPAGWLLKLSFCCWCELVITSWWASFGGSVKARLFSWIPCFFGEGNQELWGKCLVSRKSTARRELWGPHL